MSPEYSQILDELESEWNRSGDVDLEEFLRRRIRDINLADRASASFIELITEAVQIDMERRASSGSLVTVWTPEDYLKSFPILASPGILESLKLFASKLSAQAERTFLESAKLDKATQAISDNDDLGNGDQFGPYQVVREIGRGGMGTVYEAFHVHLGKRVALKLISRTVLNDQAAKTRFRREMKAVGMVDHNNVVRAMDAGEVEGSLYLVTEYIAGIDLGKLIREKGPLQSSEALLIVRQAANALQAAHIAGIVHRDVKPSNLLLTETGEVKLLDLGLARVADDVTGETTTTGSIFGTPDYMAPEQWDDVRNVDARADLYSLGCTLFYLLTGQAPFSGEKYRSPSSKMRAHLDAAVPPLSESCNDPEGLVFAMVSKMMAKKPENRYTSAAQVVQAIDNLLGPQQGNAVAALRINVTEGKRGAPGIRGPELTPPVINRPSRSVPDSGKSRQWLIPTISVLALGGVAILWSLNFGGNSKPSNVAVSASRAASKTKSSDEVTIKGDSGAGTKSPEPDASQSTAEAVPSTTTNASAARPAIVGNAHRRLAETALQFGRPVVVQFDGSGAGEILNVLEDLPDHDFVLPGNWNFFVDCPDWKDEHIDLLRGVHLWGDLNLTGTEISPFGMSKFASLDLEVFGLTISKKQLIGLGGTLNATTLNVLTTPDEQASPWPEFLGRQPQLRVFGAGFVNEHLLSLLVQNKRLHTLHFMVSDVDPITPGGLKRLAELPCLSQLSFNGKSNADELLAAVEDLPGVKRLNIEYFQCTPAAVKALSASRPDMAIHSPYMDWNEEEYASVKALIQKGAKVRTVPLEINESEKAPFIIDGISCPGALLGEIDSLTAPVRGITDFDCVDMNLADLDQLTEVLSKKESLHTIVLTGSVSKFTGATFENLSKLRSLAYLSVGLSGETESVSDEHLLRLRECQALSHLHLHAAPGIDDRGLRALSECSSINILSIGLHPSASAEGLATLQKLPDLCHLHLSGGNFDDTKLLTLAQIPTLRILNVAECVGEGFTIDGIQKLHEALPKCVIFHGNQIVFPDDAK